MIRVSIVEDNIQVAEGLKYSINFHEGFSTLDVYHSCEEALKSIASNVPDVLLLDIYLPGMNGVDCIEKIIEQNSEIQIIMLTSSDNDEHIFKSLRSGAAGYLMKNSSASQIIDSIKTVVEGGAPMSNEIARKVLNSFKEEKSYTITNNRDYNFTKRELELLQHLVECESIKTISEALFIEETTVKYHLSNIYKKLEVNSKAEAISKILKEKII